MFRASVFRVPFGLLAGLLMASLTPTPASAVEMSGIGGKLGLAAPQGYDSAVILGAQAEFQIRKSPVALMPSLHYWESRGVSDLNPNFDLIYAIEGSYSFTPYMGAGVSIHFYNADGLETISRDTGGNLFAGMAFPNGSKHYFVEARYSVGDLTQISLVGGLNFDLR